MKTRFSEVKFTDKQFKLLFHSLVYYQSILWDRKECNSTTQTEIHRLESIIDRVLKVTSEKNIQVIY